MEKGNVISVNSNEIIENNKCEVPPNNFQNDVYEIDPILDIIDYLVHHKDVSFKSQQIDESDLKSSEKKQIALNVYNKSKLLFLSKFGRFLTLNQLEYFEKFVEGDYELSYTIPQLKTLLNEDNRRLLTKNRRYEALLKMVKEESYFSETEMMRRNPLLYEQLVGQYLSERERNVRDNIDVNNITLLKVLMESMDRQQTKDILEKQRYKEECQMEETSSDEENIEDVKEINPKWGEFSKPAKTSVNDVPFITSTERSLLREEFVQEMYRSFLSGEDENIDYNLIDNNSEYDCVAIRGIDEEEKYFDSESPEEVLLKRDLENKSEGELERNIVVSGDSEDELDVYMRHLNNHPSVRHLS